MSCAPLPYSFRSPSRVLLWEARTALANAIFSKIQGTQHSTCSTSENMEKADIKMCYLSAHAPRRDAKLSCTQNRKHAEEDPRDIMWEGSLAIHSPTQSRTIHPLELVTGLLLFFCIWLLTAYEVLGSVCMAKSQRDKTCHLQAFLPNLDKEQATRAICPVHWGENQCPLSAPNHQWKGNCGPKQRKSAVLRRWKGTSMAGGPADGTPRLCRSPFFRTHKRIQASRLKVPQGRACH